MGLYIVHEEISSKYKYNAGSKARNDVESIIIDMGGSVLEVNDEGVSDRVKLNVFEKLLMHKTVSSSWIRQMKKIPKNSKIVIQYPVFFHTIFFDEVIRFLKRRGCKVIGLIHDLETLRLVGRKDKEKKNTNRRYLLEEKRTMPFFDSIIAHNDTMKRLLIEYMGLKANSIITIDIFDYLIPSYDGNVNEQMVDDYSVVIAGNLKSEKAGYIYNLPKDCKFMLYGSNYEGKSNDNICYKGSFLPDELPLNLRGDFGLIWDGPETSTCAGIYGEYLRYNNPHKTSLYLACGLPVIIWKEAAIANFIAKHQCGILIDSIDELGDVLKKVSNDRYSLLRENSNKVGFMLRNGTYTKRAIKKEL